MDPMLCASCSTALAPRRTAYGVVWVCDRCGTGAATLGVIRKVVPRGFLQHFWQAAQQHGRPSAQRCPSCTQPLDTFEGSPVEMSPALAVCRHCYFVVLERTALAAYRLGEHRALPAKSERTS